MTSETKPEIPTIVSEALRASGFPFQIAVADLVRRAPGWRVVDEEWPWQEAAGQDRFLDLVAEKGRITVSIEAKKTEKDLYTFISDFSRQVETQWWRGLVFVKEETSPRSWYLDNCTWTADPRSAAGSFCVVSPGKGGEERMLERPVQLLLRGTSAYAARYFRRFQPRVQDTPRAFVPVLVTNASLFVTEFDRESVPLDTGKLLPGEKTTPVDWFRFSKPFLTNPHHDLGEMTVFVVRAQKLSEFLALIEMIGERGPYGNVRVASDL